MKNKILDQTRFFGVTAQAKGRKGKKKTPNSLFSYDSNCEEECLFFFLEKNIFIAEFLLWTWAFLLPNDALGFVQWKTVRKNTIEFLKLENLLFHF